MTSTAFRLQYFLTPLRRCHGVAKVSMVDECVGSFRSEARWRIKSHRKARRYTDLPVHLAFLTISLAETSPGFGSGSAKSGSRCKISTRYCIFVYSVGIEFALQVRSRQIVSWVATGVPGSEHFVHLCHSNIR
jgi:hypothetical protein